MQDKLSDLNFSEISPEHLQAVEGVRMLLDMTGSNVVPVDWFSENASAINEYIKKNGVLLVRGLKLQGMRKLENVLNKVFANQLLHYQYRTSPRTKMRGRIYTSTEYYSEGTIRLHNESAYSHTWPMNIAFYCAKPSQSGGATPIADSRIIYNNIPIDIREEFERRKLMYVRNFADIDLPWSEVFQTKNKVEVEEYCQKNAIRFEWLENNGLRTKHTHDASYSHPLTGEKVWFNQAHLFHHSTIEESVRESLLSVISIDNLPKNIFYADGGEVDRKMIEIIQDVYEKHMVVFQWKEGDLLLLDNMLFSHGRQPFSGNRRVLVGMANEMTSENTRLYEH